MPGPKCLERYSSGKNGLYMQLSCYQCVFHQTEANFAPIQLQNHQNVKKKQFWQKVLGVNGLMASNIPVMYTVYISKFQLVFDFYCILDINKYTLALLLVHIICLSIYLHTAYKVYMYDKLYLIGDCKSISYPFFVDWTTCGG